MVTFCVGFAQHLLHKQAPLHYTRYCPQWLHRLNQIILGFPSLTHSCCCDNATCVIWPNKSLHLGCDSHGYGILPELLLSVACVARGWTDGCLNNWELSAAIKAATNIRIIDKYMGVDRKYRERNSCSFHIWSLAGKPAGVLFSKLWGRTYLGLQEQSTFSWCIVSFLRIKVKSVTVYANCRRLLHNWIPARGSCTQGQPGMMHCSLTCTIGWWVEIIKCRNRNSCIL